MFDLGRRQGNYQIPAQACSTDRKKSYSEMQMEQTWYWSHWLNMEVILSKAIPIVSMITATL